MVITYLSRPKGLQYANISKINNCIANSMFYYNIIRRVRKAKKFILAKIKLIWLISKDVESNFKALSCNEISRVRIIEFSVLKKNEETSRQIERKIKLQRAYGGCLGTWRRRRT